MLRNVLLKKSVVVFLIVLILTNVCAPTISWALTSGPTAPEATSFEPVDTTDLVNLATGDFTYNMPLAEVPGPSGSYPISLSYHAGIQPNEDASWVGLGWTLNPGSLTRMVNGYADDYNGSMLIDRTYWEGGSQTSYTVGVTVGNFQTASVSAGLTFSSDTYQGFGTGAYLGGKVGLKSVPGLNANAQIGISPYGKPYASTGIGLGVGNSVAQIQGGLSLSTGSGFNASAGYMIASTVGASMSSGSSKPILTFGMGGSSGSIGIANSKEDMVSTESKNFSLDIPIIPELFSMNLGRSYVRYWIDETETASAYGSLYMHKWPFLDYSAYDAYSNFSGSAAAASGLTTDELNGGTFADYDSYMVSAQGLSGSIRPYHYRMTVGRQNLKKTNEPYKVKTYNTTQQYNYNQKVEFHFENDFANRVTSDPPVPQISGGATPVAFPDFTQGTGLSNERPVPNVPGSRHIEYFTNVEMMKNNAQMFSRGFLNCSVKGFVRDSINAKYQVGGFKITNASGMTYHFSLPAYSYDEQTYTENKDHQGGDRFNYFKNPNKYAYTWYLTAITGPDFVDRNNDGLPNTGDWGNWTSFEYGLWSSTYRWRNPGQGFNEDNDNHFQTFSKGKKELYYLNAIKTSTHTALFVKEIRQDGKGATEQRDAAVTTDGNHTVTHVNQGGYQPIVYYGSTLFTLYPVSQLKLKSIYLLRNEDVPANLETSTNNYSHAQNGVTYHQGNNVIDVHDFALNQTQLVSKSIRSIHLESDYSLTPGTSNSFTSDLDVLNSSELSNNTPSGKLTLKSIKTLGKSGADLMPPTSFDYDLNKPSINTTISNANPSSNQITLIVPDENIWQIGDIIMFKQFDLPKYAYVTGRQSGQIEARLLYQQPFPSLGQVTELKTTKNPPFQQDMQDIWSCYKSDYKEYGVAYNQQHLATSIASKSVDVWSLRSVNSPLGSVIDVELESDTYTKSVFYKNFSLPLSFNTQLYNPQTGEPLAQPIVTLRGNIWGNGDISYSQYFTVGSSVDLVAVYYTTNAPPGGPVTYTPYTLSSGIVQEVSASSLVISTNIQHQPGNVYMKANMYLGSSLNKGGGIRVKSISITDPLTYKKSTTIYEYENGVTSFEPVNTDDFTVAGNHPDYIKQLYKELMLQGFVKLVTVGREIPPPGVMYGTVRVKERITGVDGVSTTLPEYSQYTFQTFEEAMVDESSSGGSFNNTSGTSQSLNYSSVQTRKGSIKSFTSMIGNLKSTTLFDGTGKKINETINHYLHDVSWTGSSFNGQQYVTALAAYNNQGVIHEVFSGGKFVKRPDNNYNVYASVSSKETYPSIQIGATTTNFKTGISTSTKNLSFDFYSGEVIKSLESDAVGNLFLTEAKPAYSVYPAMAMKEHYQFDAIKNTNKHMLTQAAGTSTFKIQDEVSQNKLAVVNASSQTWSDQVSVLAAGSGGANATQTGVWRQRSNYNFIADDNISLRPDGLYPYANFNEFNAWTGDVVPANWKKLNEIKLFNTYSHALEATDMNGNFASTKMSLDQTRVFAAASNTQYQEFAFSGLEETQDANGKLGGGVLLLGIPSSVAHTGSASASANAGQKGFSYTFTNTAAKKYHIAVWSNKANSLIKFKIGAGSDLPATVTSNQAGTTGWYLTEADVDIPANVSVQISCEANGAVTLFDDFRVHPLKATMVSYVYNKWGELTHILDNNSLYTEYEYDGMGRLKNVFKETFQDGRTKTSETQYHYANQN